MPTTQEVKAAQNQLFMESLRAPYALTALLNNADDSECDEALRRVVYMALDNRERDVILDAVKDLIQKLMIESNITDADALDAIDIANMFEPKPARTLKSIGRDHDEHFEAPQPTTMQQRQIDSGMTTADFV